MLTTKTPLESGSTPLESDRCTGEASIMYVRDGRRYCRPPCQGEKKWDQDKALCIAPNCVAAYEGYRNYWNEHTGYCEAIAVCTNGTQEYNPFTNQCDTVSPTGGSGGSESPSSGGGSNQGSGSNGKPKTEEEVVADISGPDCGEHGTVSSNGQTCVCDSGYYTDWSQSNEIRWCDKQVKATTGGTSSGSTSGSTSGSSTGASKNGGTTDLLGAISTLPLYMKLIGGFSIGAFILGIVAIGVIVIVCCVRRRKAKKAEKEKEAQKRKRDLRRESLADDQSVEFTDLESQTSSPPPKRKKKNKAEPNEEADEELAQLERMRERDRRLQAEIKFLRAEIERQKKRRPLSSEERLHVKLKAKKPLAPSGNTVL